MIGTLLFTALCAIPFAYRRGRLHGYERHACVDWPAEADRAPTTYFPVRCVACGEVVDCQLLVTAHGGADLSIQLDVTDLKIHRLRHEGAL